MTTQAVAMTALGLVRIDAPQLAYFRDTFYKAPTVLHKFAVELEAFIDGRHIFWPKLFDEVMEHPLKNGMFRRLAHPAWFSEPGSSYSPPGPSPPCAQLQDLVNAASKCETRRSSEAHWNCVVHYPVLELALKPHSTILDVVNCTSATINTGYPTQLPPSIRGDSKKVDFCIVVDQSGSGCHPAIYDIVTTDSVNHSNHPPLLSCPIAISIETKAAAPNKEEAELQMGQAIEQLGFLPGLIVLQHDWYFIAATRSVTIWRRIAIGSTDTPEGICNIICAIRYLASWVETTYWPWFCRWALGDTHHLYRNICSQVGRSSSS
ncbi:hypothetical protein B0T18DRAFT_443780 [Schizothecium vesticola]|uniref:PD-(D/E)XK nuclease-like domain-containing protein n=1 Tax=Schizothecium vesticola TaxID=314040 RepID=A0AA40F585_9PEZI|nr:hypothetical protein B0T18DRAFT_443780 [Schizothecium vesticola]